MNDIKLDGTVKAAADLLSYRLIELINSNNKNPKKTLATELCALLDFTSEQLEYIKLNTLEENTFLETIDCLLNLLKDIRQSNSLNKKDDESLVLCIQILQRIKEDAKVPIDKFFSAVNDKIKEEDNS